MENEQKNLLVSEDDLISDQTVASNFERGYTEELDFSNLVNEPIANRVESSVDVPLETVYTENNTVNDFNAETSEENNLVNNDNDSNNKINENPIGKIKFNNAQEEEEQIDPSTIKLDFKDNKNLMYVIILGLFLLVAVFTIPYIITHI